MEPNTDESCELVMTVISKEVDGESQYINTRLSNIHLIIDVQNLVQLLKSITAAPLTTTKLVFAITNLH
jgi:hypothetical protein